MDSKVEAGVGHAKKTPLRGLRFEDLDDAQAYLDRWEPPLGRHPHPRHDQAPGRRDVRRGTAGPRPVAARAVPLLPVRPPHRASGWLRRGRGRAVHIDG